MTVGEIAASLLDCIGHDGPADHDNVTSPRTGHCEAPSWGQQQTPACGWWQTPEGDDHDDRVRGGVANDDPIDAAEFFQQYGLPNLLSDDEDEADEVDAGVAVPEGWPVHQLLRPLYPGCHYNVQQFAYALMKIKTGSIRDDRADQLCKMIAEVMPAGFEGPRCYLPMTCRSHGPPMPYI